MRILITGGAGFIGLHLARLHMTRGDDITLFDNLAKQDGVRDPELAQVLVHPKVSLEALDLSQPIPTDIQCAPFDVVYHLAAINGTRLFYEKPYEVATTNLLSTLHLLSWLERNRASRLVYSSTSEVYAGAQTIGALKIPTDESTPAVFAQPLSERFSYGTSKFMGEVLCSLFGGKTGIPVTVIRYHNIYGPRMGVNHVIPEFISRALKGEDPFKLFGGNETRAFCYVEDAVKATAAVTDSSGAAGETIHIGNSSEEILISDLAKQVCSLAGVKPRFVEMGGRAGSVSRRCPDISKLQRLTSFSPAVTLEEGLAATLAWYKNQARV